MGYSTARCLMLSPYLSSKSWADFRGSASPATLYFFTHSLTVPCVTTMGGRLSVRALCNKYGEHINYITYIGPDPLYVCGMIYIYIYIYHIIYSLHIYIYVYYIYTSYCVVPQQQPKKPGNLPVKKKHVYKNPPAPGASKVTKLASGDHFVYCIFFLRPYGASYVRGAEIAGFGCEKCVQN